MLCYYVMHPFKQNQFNLNKYSTSVYVLISEKTNIEHSNISTPMIDPAHQTNPLSGHQSNSYSSNTFLLQLIP